MIISVASGKGGTGKTTIATNLALSLKNVQFIDCDVEEPNAHIFIKPSIKHIEKVNVLMPKINYSFCNFCGKCAEFCQYNAIAVFEKQVLIFPELCHHCGGCKFICPKNAITEEEITIGKIKKGNANSIDFIAGELDIAQSPPSPLIRRLKKYISKHTNIIIDAPPGTSCTMIESIEDSDFCILVTEPTPFGLNDLKLAISVVQKMNIKYGVVINQCDIGDNKVEEFCVNNKIDILMKIPYSRKIAEAYSKGESIISILPEYKFKFREMYEKIKMRVNTRNETNSNY